MAKINKDNLQSQNGDTPEAAKSPSAVVEYGPSVRVLLNGRMLGNSDILNTIGKFDPTFVPMEARLKMREDVMIKLGLLYIRTPIINADFHMECSDKQVAAFADRAYRAIHVKLCTQLLTALPIGYAGIVQRFMRDIPDWEYEDEEGAKKKVWPEKKIKAVLWNEFEVLPPRGLEPVFAADGRTFLGMRHPIIGKSHGEATSVDVPATHSLWFTNDKDEVWGDWYGRPRTQSAYRYWWSYWYQWLLADRHAEMDADPPMVVRVPANELVTDPDDDTKEISAIELGMRIGNYTRDGATVVLPSDVFVDDEGKPTSTRKWDVDFLRGGENLQAFRENFAYMDVMKLRGVLLPETALIPGNSATGGRNVAGTEVQQVEKSIEMLMGEIDQLINDVLLPPLIRQNFADAPSVRKVTTGFRPEDLSLLKQIVTILAQVDPASLDLDIRSMLNKAGLPLQAPNQNDATPGVGKDGALPAIEGQASPNANQGGAPLGNNNSQGGPNVPGGQVVVDGNQLAAAMPDAASVSITDDPLLASLFADAADLAAGFEDDPTALRLGQLEAELMRREPPQQHIDVHPPSVHVHPPNIHIALPEQLPPHIDVHSPDVHVTTPDVRVDVQPAEVTVEPHIEVHPAAEPSVRRIIRDSDQNIIEIRTEE